MVVINGGKNPLDEMVVINVRYIALAVTFKSAFNTHLIVTICTLKC